MKQILTALLILISTIIYGQSDSLASTNLVGGSHGKLRIFCGQDITDVMLDFSSFIEDDLRYSNTDAPMPKKGFINLAYVKKVSTSGKKLLVSYHVNQKDKSTYIIQNCTISGPWSQVAELFVRYWETKYNKEESSTGVVRYMASDKIIFKMNSSGIGTISIVPNH